jgi:hypothetical protein
MDINLLELKLDLFCCGLKISDKLNPAIKQIIVPSFDYSGRGMKRASLSEGSCFLLEADGNVCFINVAVRESFVKNSPYELLRLHLRASLYGIMSLKLGAFFSRMEVMLLLPPFLMSAIINKMERGASFALWKQEVSSS